MVQQRIDIGSISKLQPTVNFANRMDALPGQEWGPRTISDFQLLYILSGEATVTLGNQKYTLSTGNCIFYGNNSPHWIVSSERSPVTFASIHYHFHQESPEPIDPVDGIKYCTKKDLERFAPIYTISMKDRGDVAFPQFISLPQVEELFLQIVREYRIQDDGYSLTLRGLLMQLLVGILRYEINSQYSSTSRRKIAPSLEAIQKQPSMHWTTSELASLCGYNPTYFASLFREATGHSPKHYLILERIRKAKSLILEAETIENVAKELGYTSPHYFCRNFKTITGLTPTQFKKRSFEL